MANEGYKNLSVELDPVARPGREVGTCVTRRPIRVASDQNRVSPKPETPSALRMTMRMRGGWSPFAINVTPLPMLGSANRLSIAAGNMLVISIPLS